MAESKKSFWIREPALILVAFLLTPFAHTFECRQLLNIASEYRDSLAVDLDSRSKLPQTDIDEQFWTTCCGKYGPWPTKYSNVEVPFKFKAIKNKWLRDRLVLVSKQYIGLPYKHAHFPMMGGLDCSNFVSWVFNYGLGIQLVSNIREQAYTVGRLLNSGEKLLPGDLIYTWSKDRLWVSHVVIYIGNNEIIDANINYGISVQKYHVNNYEDQSFSLDRLAWIRRVIE